MKFKRTFGIGDVHGTMDLLMFLIKESIRFNPETDRLVFCGDCVDRGKGSLQVFTYLMELREKYPDNIILLKGNHEEMAMDAFDGVRRDMWLEQGGQETLDSFGGEENAKSILIPFINSLLPYFEIENTLFLHGGIPAGKDMKDCTESEILWERDNHGYKGTKHLVVGHTMVKRVITLSNNVTMIDTGAYLTGKLSAIEVNTKKVFQAVRSENHIVAVTGRNPAKESQKTIERRKRWEKWTFYKPTEEEWEKIIEDKLSGQFTLKGGNN